MFLQFFIRIAAVFCMIGFGVLAKKLMLIDNSATTQLAKLVTWFFYPALVFSSLVENFTLGDLLSNWALPAGALLIMALGYAAGFLSAGLLSFASERRKNQFIFQSTINNYSFLPLPIILMLWGGEGVAMLVFSTLGSEIAVWTLGVFALSGNRFRRDSLRNLLSVPMLAIISAMAVIAIRSGLGAAGIDMQACGVFREISRPLLDMLEVFGGAAIPLAMFLAGSRIADLKPGNFFTLGQTVLVVMRLLIIPAAAVLMLHLLPFQQELRQILLVVAVMPCAIASVMLSEVYDSDTDFAASSVLTTQAVSIITIPLWLAVFLG